MSHSKPYGSFLLIWFGQVLAQIGAGITLFALGIWVFRKTGSTTQFALISFFTMMASMVAAPLAGVVADRWERRRAMLLSDFGSLLLTLAIALLLYSDRLEIWNTYLLLALFSILGVVHWSAYSASITLMVPKQHYGRASGMVQSAQASTRIVAPWLAGALFAAVDIEVLVLIHAATLALSFSTLILAWVPRPQEDPSLPSAANRSLLREAFYGWTYIRQRRGLLALLMLFAASNFLLGFVSVLVTPLVLSFADEQRLGMLLSVGGAGMLAGSLTMSVWGGPRNRVRGILALSVFNGICIAAAGLTTSIPFLAAAVALVYFCMPIITGANQAIWQSKVEPGLQGRVFAVRRMIGWSFLPLAALIAGPLADYVFEPLMSSGRLADLLGPWMGSGAGRGIGLLLTLAGLLFVAVSLVASRARSLTQVEKELPDTVPDTLAEPAVSAAQA